MPDQPCHQPADEENVERKATRDCPKPRKESAVPKFYVESGSVHLILDAATAEEAAVKAFQWTCDKRSRNPVVVPARPPGSRSTPAGIRPRFPT